MVGCLVDGCEAKHFGHGYCRNHYERWKRNGDVELRRDSSRGCYVEGCGRKHFGKGMCKPHYRRFLKYGDPLGSAPPPVRVDPYGRWLRRVRVTDDCWLWTGTLNNGGYGMFWFDGGTVTAHRWSYEHHKGPLGDKVVDHLCRVRHCVNPEHLEAVTQQENQMRGPTTKAAMNAAKTHCPKGHPYDEVNTYRDKQGRRSCIACRDANTRRYLERKRLARNQA